MRKTGWPFSSQRQVPTRRAVNASDAILMLLPDEFDLIRREPAIPGLALLLDDEKFAAALAAIAPDAGLERVTPTYLNYLPGIGGLAAYRLTFADIEVDAYLKAFAGEAREELYKAKKKSKRSRPPGFKALALEQFNAALYVFPLDNKLKTLRTLHNAENKRRLFENLFGDRRDLIEGTLHLLKYKPERRFVARLDLDGAPRALVKFFKPASYEAAKEAPGKFSSQGRLKIAGLLGHSDEHRALAFEWFAGAPLRRTVLATGMLESERLAAVELAGAALGELHCQETVQSRQQAEFVVNALGETAAIIERICPRVEADVDRLVRYLIEHLEEPTSMCNLHGDFYDEQVLYSTDAAAIIDFDQSRLGDPAEDLGRFIAHLERETIRGQLARNDVESMTDALMKGYGQTGIAPAGSSILLYTAVGLLSLAAEPFRFRESNWPEKMQAIIASAGNLVKKHSREAL